MGTNFYAVIPVKSRDKERAKKLIDENKLEEAIELLQSMTTEIHLGKRSAGWKFLFNTNLGNYYNLTKDGINKFFKETNAIIKDEYGHTCTVEEFWNDEIGTSLEKGYDLESYYENNPAELREWCYSRTVPEELKKYNPNIYGEFYSDGLRFTTCTEFC